MTSVGEQWRAAFSELGSAYGAQFDARFMIKFLRSPYVELPRRYARLGVGKRPLEAGCGSAKFSLCFARLGCDALALDFSSDIAANVRARGSQARAVWGALSLTIVRGDLECLNFRNDSFDLTCNEGVVEHWLDDRERMAVLREMVRVTKPGGSVCVIVPNGKHPFLPYWTRHQQAHHHTPPMTDYTTASLAHEFQQLGLREIVTDGIYAWRSLDQYPSYRPLQILGGALQRVVPLPKRVRQRWGVNLIALGRKA